MKQWNRIFKKQGRVFLEPHEDMVKVADLFKKHNFRKILDLGCGTGRHVIFLARKGFKVSGIDIAEQGIKITKEWLKSEKLQADLNIGSIYNKLPYKNNSFDAVISTNTIHHGKIENIRKSVREISRVLKPGGMIFITVRKRKFGKFYPNSTIIEGYGHQKYKYKVIDSRTYVPIEGGEKGLIHYLFNKELIRKEFKDFKIPDIWQDSVRRHYCFVGELKS